MLRRLKSRVKKILKPESILYRIIRKLYRILSKIKHKMFRIIEKKKRENFYSKKTKEYLKKIVEYKNEKYIIFYNPTWLGVANSTKGLFKNNVPLEHMYKRLDVKKVVNSIIENNINMVIFSQICDGWINLIEELNKEKKDIKIKVIWHGNCYEFFSDFTWNLNKQVIQLYHENKIDSFGFVRSTMYEFYKAVGIKCFYLQNNVKLNIENTKEYKNKKEEIRIGIYNADSRELKNIYTSLSAVKLLKNGVADIVPINEGAKQFSKILELKTEFIEDYIDTKELLNRMKKNDINLYPTFTENSPMLPLESFEIGVPCLLGNNNDYFKNTELEEYVVLKREDDYIYIKEKILFCLNNREKVMKLYKKWKKEYDLKCNNLVENFIKI